MTEYAMTQTAPRAKLEQSANMSPLQPAWLRPAAITLIVIAHIAFCRLYGVGKPSIVALESMTMDLVQEGDFFEAEEAAEAEDRPPPVVVEDPELALPPPEVMAPDAIPLPAKRDNLEKSKSNAKSNKQNKQPKRVKRKRDAMQELLTDALGLALRNQSAWLTSLQISVATRLAQQALALAMRM